ncbi:CHAP domain-containing protein [Streptococcus halichoeri]|uniref:CHAP domain-containing protein n=1 Tax=Streptococcus halichoeri TaxID=254785 RepID=UPI0039A5B4E7
MKLTVTKEIEINVLKKERHIALFMLLVLLASSMQTLSVAAQEVQTPSAQTVTTASKDPEIAPKEAGHTESASQSTQATLPSETLSMNSATDTTALTQTSSSKDLQEASEASQAPAAPSTAPATTPSTSTPSSSSSAKPSTTVPSATEPKPSQAPNVGTKPNHVTPVQPQAQVQAPLPQSASSAPAALFDDSDLDIMELPSAIASASYVKHWSGKDAYTHNLLSHRYGIKAEQLDGFLQSTKIAYDQNRINGKKILEWEKLSGLDARAIIAIAMAESSLGTAGVATEPGANMFGFGAFDHNPSNARNFNDEKAVIRMTQETIIQNYNTSFALQDKKAKLLAIGQLNVSLEGSVYFTDASGTGKARAKIMESVDEWIDQHGGTPEIPKELLLQSSASLAAVPVGYKLAKTNHVLDYVAGTYPWGQCTWYVYNRAQELGYRFGPYMGNGGSWKYAAGYETTHQPKVGYAISFNPGQAGADPTFGHVAIVEDVKEDGSILISESNCLGLGTISYRTFTAGQAAMLTYVVGQSIN